MIDKDEFSVAGAFLRFYESDFRGGVGRCFERNPSRARASNDTRASTAAAAAAVTGSIDRFTRATNVAPPCLDSIESFYRSIGSVGLSLRVDSKDMHVEAHRLHSGTSSIIPSSHHPITIIYAFHPHTAIRKPAGSREHVVVRVRREEGGAAGVDVRLHGGEHHGLLGRRGLVLRQHCAFPR